MEIDTGKLFEEVMDRVENSQQSEYVKLKDAQTNDPTVDTDEVYYDEEVLSETLDKDFSYQIIDRGEDYYNKGNVLNVYRNKNKYVAKVCGNSDKPYEVAITVKDEDTAQYECTCPCTFPCKHEYAVIMAISNHEYSEVELKTPVKEKEANIKSIIQEIPADELKAYLLSPKGMDKVAVEMDSFTEYFRKYFPKQKYEFYYNNLYNALALEDGYIIKIESYLERAKQYLTGNDFDEVFKIVQSIVEAYNDTNKLNFDDYVFELINKMGMILRISYRKADISTKTQIKEWSEKLETANYYNNYYLEDLILSLR